MTTITTATEAKIDRGSTGDRLWSLLGTLSAVLYFIGIATFNLDTPVADQGRALRVGASTALIAAMLLSVYGIHLRRYLADQLPARSVIPAMASAGTVAASATMAIVALVRLALAQPGAVVGRLGTGANELIDTLDVGAWMPFLLTLVAVAIAGLRFGAFSRWLGVVGAVTAAAGALLVVAGGPPMFLPSALWLVVAGVGLAASRR